jgi:hypothetical protein
MRFIFQLAVAVVLTGLLMAVAHAEKAETGIVKGEVNFCGKGGVEGMQVYIPGLPFVVITGADGRFQFSAVPAGKYDLHYRLGERLLNRNHDVYVMSKQVTDLAEISFCNQLAVTPKPLPAATSQTQGQPAVVSEKTQSNCDAADPACQQDADGDGVMAAQDCDDNDARTHPGAIELCDGKDNNCNGQIDDNVFVLVAHGVGLCKSGQVAVKSCKEGFSDCDGEASNGCETDINNDAEHCGGCNEECTPTEICVAGGCE